jgi:hypothetical protein
MHRTAKPASFSDGRGHTVFSKHLSIYSDYHFTVQWLAEKVSILVGSCHIIIIEDPDMCIIRGYRGWQRKAALQLILATLST